MRKSLQVLVSLSAIAVMGSSWAISISDTAANSDRNSLSVGKSLAVTGAITEFELISTGYEMVNGDLEAGLWISTYNATLQLGGTYKEAELAAEAVVMNFKEI